jgi:membrane-associated protease RseP (regulator of RpoE activity)
MRLAVPAALAVLAAIPGLAFGQETVYVRRAQPAWLGIGYDVQWIQRDDRCEARAVVQSVVEGSPAQRAGLRPGDALLAVNGLTSPGTQLPRLASRLSPGDSVRIKIRRGTAVREITAVAEPRPERPPTFALESGSDGFRATSAPVIRVTGDSLVAINVQAGKGWVGEPTTGYWVASEDGRTEFRRLSSWSRNDLDQRVANLLLCVDTVAEAPIVPVTTARIELRAVQERADSLRVVIAERALARDGRDVYSIAIPQLVGTGDAPAVAPDVRVYSPNAFVYSAEDHVAAGLRGVAGAELTSLEPELAEYFRNVREGLLVLRVAPGTPADRAGLRPGDVIVAADGSRLDAITRLRVLLTRTGDVPIALRVVRNGRSLTTTLRRD